MLLKVNLVKQKEKTFSGLIPAKLSENIRPNVPARFANEVDDVNQYAAPMYDATINAILSLLDINIKSSAELKNTLNEINDDKDVDLSDKTIASDVKKIKTMVSKVGDGTEEIDESIEEGRMKELHGYIDQGMSAEQIAKKMKLDVKTIKALMAGYGEDFELNEMKMNDPKLLKVFDKLKRGDKVKLKTSSTISQGKDYVEYIVKSKNTVNKGRVEKVTLATVGNEKAVKKFLYKRDGQVTFAIGDMGASIDDIKETTNNMAAYTAAITKQIGEK